MNRSEFEPSQRCVDPQGCTIKGLCQDGDLLQDAQLQDGNPIDIEYLETAHDASSCDHPSAVAEREAAAAILGREVN